MQVAITGVSYDSIIDLRHNLVRLTIGESFETLFRSSTYSPERPLCEIIHGIQLMIFENVLQL